jgi:hypothetical protein
MTIAVLDVTTGQVTTLEEAAPVFSRSELPPTKAQIEQMRRGAYTQEADPLFFQWQAGEGTEADWLAKRQEIRDRYPYPAE